MQRALQEQPNAEAAHRSEMRNELPAFLRAMSKSLTEIDSAEVSRHRLLAVEHGEQRWQHGWQLSEVVRDYQILRLVLLDHLDSALIRRLTMQEIMAIGLVLDEAIAS